MKAELKQQRERFYKLLSNDEEIIALGRRIIENEIEGESAKNWDLIKFTLGQYNIEASMYDPLTIDSPRPQMYSDILKANAMIRCIDYVSYGSIRV